MGPMAVGFSGEGEKLEVLDGSLPSPRRVESCTRWQNDNARTIGWIALASSLQAPGPFGFGVSLTFQ